MKRMVIMLATAAALWAQDPRGTIAGKISDSSGAVVPGATVRAKNAETNVVTTATSNPVGNYELLYLLPGSYAITAEHAGFKGWSKPAVELRMADRLLVDIRMEVGAVTETVEVSARAVVLESSTAGVGQLLDARQIGNLPLRSGSISWLYSMSAGVIWQRIPYDGPWNIDDASALSVAGAGSSSMDFNMDGVSNNSYSGKTAFVPPADMVAEMRVDTASYDASVGHTTGGAVNVVLKSGTNQLHGSLWAEMSSGPMQTRTFFTDQFIYDPTTGPITPAKIAANSPSVRWNRYSAVAGGPVMIPKVYNGKNKTFWEFGYQQSNRTRPISSFYTVPTVAGRTGDLSALLALGSQYQIYDPFSIAPSGGGRFSRLPIPGNRIPTSRMDATALKIMQFYPLPNVAGTADGTNNYSRTRKETQSLVQPIVRIDQNFSDRYRMFGRYSESDFTGHFDELIPNSNVRGRYRQRPSRSVALDGVVVLTSNAVLDLRYGFTWFREHEYFDNQGYDLSSLGFSSTLVNEVNQINPAAVTFPQLQVDNFVQLGQTGGWQQTNYSHSLLGVLTWTHGNHSLKAGFDGRLPIETYNNTGNVSPNLTFGSTYTNGPLDNSPGAPIGQGFASFLFGIPTSGFVNYNASFADVTHFYGPFVQDDWRISRKLTLNVGLRWEFESPPVERYNRTAREFDFQTMNPTEQQAQQQYALHPVPQVPVSSFQTLGGVTFAGVGGNPRGIRNPDYRCFMPRVGLAYQVTPRLVMRAGYGIFYGMLGVEFSNAVQPGFSMQTNLVASADNGVSYLASIANPLPSGIQLPLGTAGGLTTNLGGSPGFLSPDGTRSYTQRWSDTLQFQPMSGSVVEVGYLGSKSVDLRVTRQFNAVPRQYLSTLPTRDQTVINLLSAQVPNPFVGIPAFAGTGLYTTANTSLSQLLLPYPEFGGLSTDIPAGFSWYHALTARFEKRFRHGMEAQANYTFSKTMDALDYLNATDSKLEHVISTLDRPHRLAFSAVWELPFGRGRDFGAQWPGVLNQVAGGWAIDAIYQFQSGAPIDFGNLIFTCSSYNQLQMRPQSLQEWFNTGCFQRSSQLQLANNIRTFPTRLASVRAAGMNIADLSVHKQFPVHERLKLELRGDAEGIMNHPNFAAPNTTPTSLLFGQVTSTQTGQEERRIFVGLKLMF